MWCRHLDGDPTNNRAENLAWGTPQDNADDTVMHGRSTRGGRNPMAKLTEDDVREIRRLRHSGMMLHEIGTQFGIADSTVCRIAKGVEWGHVR
jgi:DNA invertase Pin-like site-specific DNA recombinase